jgi:Tol biopolymer transport system component
LLIALAVIVCFIVAVMSQRATAQVANGKIAFTSDNVIYTINPDGSGLLQLTQTGNGFSDRFPVWSPDGNKIAFGRTTFTVHSQIYVMNADGSNATRLKQLRRR